MFPLCHLVLIEYQILWWEEYIRYSKWIFVNMSQKILPIAVYKSQYGFIAKIDISHNIWNVFMLKIYLEKDYDNVGWYFLSNLMSRMGIGIYMSMLYTYILGERVVSRVMLNCGFTCSLIIHKSARQGYCFESLLFFIVVLIHYSHRMSSIDWRMWVPWF